jgi:hypothetical protein
MGLIAGGDPTTPGVWEAVLLGVYLYWRNRLRYKKREVIKSAIKGSGQVAQQIKQRKARDINQPTVQEAAGQKGGSECSRGPAFEDLVSLGDRIDDLI